MKALILAAGYATRLYPLTETRPKPLLPVGGRPILEHILADLETIPAIGEIVVVTNDRFHQQFCQWKEGLVYSLPVSLLNDGTRTNETRLGAIRDIRFAIEKKALDEDLFILAGDNLCDFSLKGFVDFFRRRKRDALVVHEERDGEKLKKTGVAEVSGGRVISFEEKPPVPKGFYAVPPFYIYTRETLPLFEQYLEEGNNPDAPGYFVAWLVKRKAVDAYPVKGRRYDIGDMASYEEAKRRFKPRV